MSLLNKISETKQDSQQTWSQLMKKMDGNGAPLPKRQVNRKPPLLPAMDKTLQNGSITDDSQWDNEKHGYFLSRGELVYKMPGGRVNPASGVDAFGNF